MIMHLDWPHCSQETQINLASSSSCLLLKHTTPSHVFMWLTSHEVRLRNWVDLWKLKRSSQTPNGIAYRLIFSYLCEDSTKLYSQMVSPHLHPKACWNRKIHAAAENRTPNFQAGIHNCWQRDIHISLYIIISQMHCWTMQCMLDCWL